MLEFGILGPLEVRLDGRLLGIPAGQQRALLALLILNANRVVSADRIVDQLWVDGPPQRGTKALAFHVSRLRDALAPERRLAATTGCIETEKAGYVLRADPDAIDALRFERLAGEGHRLLHDDPAAARSRLGDALELWRGDALVDVAYADYAQAEIQRLEELRLAALEDRLDADLRLGAHAAAIAELEALLRANPLRERLRGLLMLALYRSGRQAEALRVAGDGRRLLSEELGIDPSPELVQLEAQILAHDQALVLASHTVGSAVKAVRNPYKGLRAFTEADCADFFGREALVGRLLARVDEVAHDGRLLVLVGPSGSGKSSAIRAGLIPALRGAPGNGGGAWQIVTMVPGAAPFRELAAGLATIDRALSAEQIERAEAGADLRPLLAGALSSGQAGVLLFIDQLEELFARVDAQTRERFIRALVRALKAAEPRLVVVATLRADFLHAPLLERDFGELLRTGVELVTPLTRPELERAIERPAQAVGAELEPALVAQMVTDVENQPGALPLLEYALTALFERGAGRLTRDGYDALGGVGGALERRADEAWHSLDGAGRDLAQQVLLRLVATSDGGAPAAQRVRLADLDSLAPERHEIRRVVDHLARHGLLAFDSDPVSGEPSVQIAHEALLLHWARLANWIEDMRVDLWTRRRIAEAADEWSSADRSAGFLASGAKLDQFTGWARTTRLRLTETERAYLAAGVKERSRLAHRSRAIRGLFAAVIVGAVVLAGGLSAALLNERQASLEGADITLARELASVSSVTLGQNRQLGILLALEAADATADRGYVVEEAYDALQFALQEAQVQYPSGALPAAVTAGPGGPRGLFMIPPDELMRLGAASIQRPLDADECRTYMHAENCPPVQPPPAGTTLALRTSRGVMPAALLADATLAGTRVRVVSELPTDISPALVALEDSSGIRLDWQPASGGDLQARIDARDLPDLAIVSRPSSVASDAHLGWLLDIDGLADTSAVAAQADAYTTNLGVIETARATGTATGRYGVPIAVSVDDLLWYPKTAFDAAAYSAPTSLDELSRLVGELHDAGRVPWCLGIEAGDRSGAAAAAWVENLVLQQQGVALYDRWVRGEVAFASAPVLGAFEQFGELVMGDGDVFSPNGLDSIDLIPERIAMLPMLLPDGPRCWLAHGASSDLTFNLPGMTERAGEVPFPAAVDGAQNVMGRVYMVVVLADRPEVREAAAWLLSDGVEAAIAATAGTTGIFPLRTPAKAFSGPLAGEADRLYGALAAGTFRARAVDLLPDSVAAGFMADVWSFLWWATPDIADHGFASDAAWDELRRQPAP